MGDVYVLDTSALIELTAIVGKQIVARVRTSGPQWAHRHRAIATQRTDIFDELREILNHPLVARVIDPAKTSAVEEADPYVLAYGPARQEGRTRGHDPHGGSKRPARHQSARSAHQGVDGHGLRRPEALHEAVPRVSPRDELARVDRQEAKALILLPRCTARNATTRRPGALDARRASAYPNDSL